MGWEEERRSGEVRGGLNRLGSGEWGAGEWRAVIGQPGWWTSANARQRQCQSGSRHTFHQHHPPVGACCSARRRWPSLAACCTVGLEDADQQRQYRLLTPTTHMPLPASAAPAAAGWREADDDDVSWGVAATQARLTAHPRRSVPGTAPPPSPSRDAAKAPVADAMPVHLEAFWLPSYPSIILLLTRRAVAELRAVVPRVARKGATVNLSSLHDMNITHAML